MCASISSRGTPPSRFPREKAKPAEVVASALNPRRRRYIAVPISQGFGRTKHPDSCIARNFAAAEACCVEFISQILGGSSANASFAKRRKLSRGPNAHLVQVA